MLKLNFLYKFIAGTFDEFTSNEMFSQLLLIICLLTGTHWLDMVVI